MILILGFDANAYNLFFCWLLGCDKTASTRRRSSEMARERCDSRARTCTYAKCLLSGCLRGGDWIILCLHEVSRGLNPFTCCAGKTNKLINLKKEEFLKRCPSNCECIRQPDSLLNVVSKLELGIAPTSTPLPSPNPTFTLSFLHHSNPSEIDTV